MKRRNHGATGADQPLAGAPTASTDSLGAEGDVFGGVELFEDRMTRIAGGHAGRRLGVSIPGALAGVLLVGALAFGAGFGPTAAPSGAGHAGQDATADELAGDGKDGGDDVLGHGGDGDDWAPDADKDIDNEPTGDSDEPKPIDEPADEPTSMALGLALEGTKVVVEWSICDFDGFRAYKVVRSTDETVSWPLGEGDVLVGVLDGIAETRLLDGTGSAGRTYFYRVFAVRSVDGSYVVACKSDVRSIKIPAPEPTDKPDPTVKPDGFPLEVWIGDKGMPVMEWGSCGDVDYTKFKVVRSLDGTVTWPLGDNDALIAATGPDDHEAWDTDAPGGKKLFYRVFCVRATESGYVVTAASVVDAVMTPVIEPAPDPVTLGFEIDLTAEGVVLHWEDCTSEAFAFYKVVRSMNENPSYLPYTDGTQVIGVIENHSVVGLTDADVASGQTWYYRIQSIGYWGGQKIVLGQTAVIAVTIP